MDAFFQYLKGYIQVSKEEEAIIASHLKSKKYLKGQYILQNGDVSRHQTFILSGKGGNIEAGEFVLDMGSIACTDKGLDDKSKGGLVGHLSGSDFFDVAKFPEAKFEIAEVSSLEGVEGMTHSIKGNLTMKEATKSVTFNANVSADANGVTATSNNFKINRTEWGVNYGSINIFKDLKDGIVNDEIGLTVVLVAK